MIWYAYLAINLTVALLDTVLNRNKKYIAAVLLVTVIILIGMRYEVGVDWVVYESLFLGNEINVQFEPGYIIISNLFSQLNLDFWFFVFIITVSLLLTLNVFFRKNSPLPLFCLGVYYTMSFAFNIDFLRQLIAFTTCLWAISLYINKNSALFFLVGIVAVMMHASAAIILLIPFINKDSFRKYALLLLVVGIILSSINQSPVEWFIKSLSLISNSVYIEKIKLYASSTADVQVFTVNLFFKIIIFAVYYLNKNKIYKLAEQSNRTDSLKVFISLFYLMMLIDIYLGKYGTIRLRLDEYLNPAFIIIISYIIMSFKKTLSKQMFTIFVLVYCFSSFIKFTFDPYFLGQFEYHNSLISIWKNESELDATRRNNVYLYWQEREKITVGD